MEEKRDNRRTFSEFPSSSASQPKKKKRSTNQVTSRWTNTVNMDLFELSSLALCFKKRQKQKAPVHGISIHGTLSETIVFSLFHPRWNDTLVVKCPCQKKTPPPSWHHRLLFCPVHPTSETYGKVPYSSPWFKLNDASHFCPCTLNREKMGSIQLTTMIRRRVKGLVEKGSTPFTKKKKVH